MFVVSLFYDFFKPLEINQLGWISLAYVIVFGSVLAMTAYLFALKNLPATIASMYTYINPIIAIFLGIIFLQEKNGRPDPARHVGDARRRFPCQQKGIKKPGSSHLDPAQNMP